MGINFLDVARNEARKYRSVSGTNGDSVKAKITYNNDGSINEKETYSKEYLKEQEKKAKASKKQARVEAQSESNSDGCIMKIIKTPFKLLFWLIKNILKIVLAICTLGLISDFMSDDKDK